MQNTMNFGQFCKHLAVYLGLIAIITIIAEFKINPRFEQYAIPLAIMTIEAFVAFAIYADEPLTVVNPAALKIQIRQTQVQWVLRFVMMGILLFLGSWTWAPTALFFYLINFMRGTMYTLTPEGKVIWDQYVTPVIGLRVAIEIITLMGSCTLAWISFGNWWGIPITLMLVGLYVPTLIVSWPDTFVRFFNTNRR